MKKIIASAAVTLLLAGGGVGLATATAHASHNPPHCASLASIYQGALDKMTNSPARPAIVVAYNSALAAHHCTQQVS